MGHTSTDRLPPVADWPLYWFAQLERAIERDDLQAAADAQQQLRRLGVRVSIELHHAKRQGAAHVE